MNKKLGLLIMRLAKADVETEDGRDAFHSAYTAKVGKFDLAEPTEEDEQRDKFLELVYGYLQHVDDLTIYTKVINKLPSEYHLKAAYERLVVKGFYDVKSLNKIRNLKTGFTLLVPDEQQLLANWLFDELNSGSIPDGDFDNVYELLNRLPDPSEDASEEGEDAESDESVLQEPALV